MSIDPLLKDSRAPLEKEMISNKLSKTQVNGISHKINKINRCLRRFHQDVWAGLLINPRDLSDIDLVKRIKELGGPNVYDSGYDIPTVMNLEDVDEKKTAYYIFKKVCQILNRWYDISDLFLINH